MQPSCLVALVLRRQLVNDGRLRRRWSSRVNLKAKGRRSIINKPFKEYGNTMTFHYIYVYCIHNGICSYEIILVHPRNGLWGRRCCRHSWTVLAQDRCGSATLGFTNDLFDESTPSTIYHLPWCPSVACMIPDHLRVPLESALLRFQGSVARAQLQPQPASIFSKGLAMLNPLS